MLLGEFNHSIDEKGRLIIPAKLRDDLGENFVICNGLEGCLFVKVFAFFAAVCG